MRGGQVAMATSKRKTTRNMPQPPEEAAGASFEPARDRLTLAIATSFYVGDQGELSYQANVYPASSEKPVWFAVLTGQVGSAPDFPKECAVPAELRACISAEVRQSAQKEFERLLSAVADSQVKGVTQ